MWNGLVWTGLLWSELVWTGPVWTSVDWTRLDWTKLVWTGLDWSGLVWTGALVVLLAGRRKKERGGEREKEQKTLSPNLRHSSCLSLSLLLTVFWLDETFEVGLSGLWGSKVRTLALDRFPSKLRLASETVPV